MPGIDSPLQIIIVLLVAAIILGPKRLPGAARSVGRGIREFKETVNFKGPPEPPPHPPAAQIEPPREVQPPPAREVAGDEFRERDER